jgi:hypothetical protein
MSRQFEPDDRASGLSELNQVYNIDVPDSGLASTPLINHPSTERRHVQPVVSPADASGAGAIMMSPKVFGDDLLPASLVAEVFADRGLEPSPSTATLASSPDEDANQSLPPEVPPLLDLDEERTEFVANIDLVVSRTNGDSGLPGGDNGLLASGRCID